MIVELLGYGWLGNLNKSRPLTEATSCVVVPCPLQLSKDTHGFVGADLSQLCMEAALRCIREQMHTIDVDSDKIPVVSSFESSRVQ